MGYLCFYSNKEVKYFEEPSYTYDKFKFIQEASIIVKMINKDFLIIKNRFDECDVTYNYKQFFKLLKNYSDRNLISLKNIPSFLTRIQKLNNL